jgi:hypothetical protein
MSLSLDKIAEDYYSHAYGEDWRSFYNYLSRLDKAFGFGYLELEESADLNISKLYNPERAKLLSEVPEIIKEGRALIKEHYNSPIRLITASVRILEEHARYAELYADALSSKAVGEDDEAIRKVEKMMMELSAREPITELYFDYELASRYVMQPILEKGRSSLSIDTM